MATQLPLKIYKEYSPATYADSQYNRTYNYTAQPSYNTPYGFQETTLDDFLQNATDYQKKTILSDINNLTGQQYTDINQAFSSPSGFVIDPVTGNLTTTKAIDSEAANQAGVASGTLREISPGMYIPTGSAADYASQGMSFDQQLQQNSVQQQIQQQNLTPISPAVVSSDAARTATTNNLNTLQATEQAYAVGNAAPTGQTTQQTTTGTQSAIFYKPDPNKPQVYNAQNQPVSYEDYIAQGGKPDFSNVQAGSPPVQLQNSGTANNPALGTVINNINYALSNGTVSKDASAMVTQANTLANTEAATTAAARSAADNKDFGTLNNLMEQLKTIQKTRTDLIAKISTNLEKSQDEIDQETKLAELKSSYQAGKLVIEGQPVPMPFIAGQSNELTKTAELKISNAIANLERLQNARLSKVDALKFLFNANEGEITDKINMYKLAAPENITTQVDDNGNITVVTRNPIDGTYSTNRLPNIKVTQPFYKYDNDSTVYTRDGKPLPDKMAYTTAGGKGDWTDVQTIPSNSDLTFDTVTVDGQLVRYGFDSSGKMVSKQVLGTAGGGTTGERQSTNQADVLNRARNLPKGTDGKASPLDYLRLMGEYITAGGTKANFFSIVPPESAGLSPENAAWVQSQRET